MEDLNDNLNFVLKVLIDCADSSHYEFQELLKINESCDSKLRHLIQVSVFSSMERLFKSYD